MEQNKLYIVEIQHYLSIFRTTAANFHTTPTILLFLESTVALAVICIYLD